MRGISYAIRQAKKEIAQIRINKLEDLPVNVEKIAEKHNVNIIKQPLSTNMSGVFFKKGNRLFLAVNSKHNEHRQRFTIAHEIGHYILHSRNEILYYDNHPFFRADNVLNSDEVEANSFAAELLIPQELVIKLIDNGVRSIQELAGRFNVSEDAMRYRLTNLGFL